MRLPWLAACCLMIASPAFARPYGVDDMLAIETYGQVLVDPRGRWAAIDRYRRYDSGSDYAYDAFTSRTLGQVMRIDLADPGRLEPMFPQNPKAGYWLGRLSPSGTKLTVFRLTDRQLSLGVVDVAARSVTWLAETPATPLLNPAPVWIDDDRLLMIAAPQGALTFPLDSGSRLQDRVSEQWHRTAEGRTAGVSVKAAPGAADQQAGFALLLLDLKAGTRRSLAQGRIVDVALAADRQFAAITLETEPAAPPSDTLVRASEFSWRHGIHVIRLADGARHDVCADCDTLPNLLAWSPKGHRLLYYAKGMDTDWSTGRLHVHDAEQATSHPVLADVPAFLPDDDSGARIVRADWLGSTPILYAAPKPGAPRWIAGAPDRQVRWLLSALPCQPPVMRQTASDLLVLCGETLWLVAASGQRTKLVMADTLSFAQGWSESFDIGVRARFDPLPRIGSPVAWYRTAVGARTVATGGVAGRNLPDHAARVIDAGHGTLIAIDRQPNGSGGLWVLKPGIAPARIDRINAHLADVDLARTLKLDGPQAGLSHWLMLPPTKVARQEAKLPLVVIPYPGQVFGSSPPSLLDPTRIMAATNVQILAGLGYAVLLPSLPSTRASGEPAEGLGAAIVAATDRAIATGLIDPARLVVYGNSFGGFTALASATQTDRFAAVIASAGPYDLRLSHGALLPYDRIGLEDGFPLGSGFGWAETGQGHLGGAPWQQAERYRRNSPIESIDRITSPVLLIHGDLDPVSIANAERAYAALYRQGKDVTLLSFWGEGHNIRSPANIHDMWQRIAAWLAQRLARPHRPVSTSAAPKARARPAG